MSSHGQNDEDPYVDTTEDKKRKHDDEKFLISQSQHDRERLKDATGTSGPIAQNAPSNDSDSPSHHSSSSSTSNIYSASDRSLKLKLMRFGLVVFVALVLVSLYRVIRGIAEGGLGNNTSVFVTDRSDSNESGDRLYNSHNSVMQNAFGGTMANAVGGVNSSGKGGIVNNDGIDERETSFDDLMQSSVSSPHFDPNAMNREPDLSFIEDISIEEGKSFDSTSEHDISAESEIAADNRMSEKAARYDAMSTHSSAMANTVDASGKSCIAKKRIILSVNKCGLGNRMVSLASTIMLALLMDRVVELDWKNNRYCSASYTDLFHAKSQINLNHDFRPFIFDPTMQHPNDVKSRRRVCQLYFDQTLNYKHLSFLAEKNLFDRLNNECHVIKIQANIYYAHLLLNDNIGSRLKKTFHLTSPFHHIAQIVFRPDDARRQSANEFILEHMKGEKWLSIHARGYYDDGSHTDKALECAKRLLNLGEISYVYFATETLRLLEKAQKEIPAGKLITTPHETVADSAYEREDSMSIRNDMDSAILDWLLIGSATYCTATIMGQSTFSKTSIVSGPCIYIDYSGDVCSVEVDSTIQGHHKEALMHYDNKDKINVIPTVPDKEEQEKIWRSVERSEEGVVEQCYREEWPDFADLYKYWGVDEERGMRRRFVRHQVAVKPAPNRWGLTIAANDSVTQRKDIPKERKQKLTASRFKNKENWPSGGFEAAEARRCAMAGCNPGFIEGYKDDPSAVNPETLLHPPSFANSQKDIGQTSN